MSDNTDNNSVLVNDNNGKDLPKVTTEVNNDELIMAQEKQIERDIAESIPIFGKKLEINDFQRDYSTDDVVYQQKVADLLNHYKYIRKIRPDGNCFFRGFIFGYFEYLMNDKQELSRFYKLLEESKDILVKQGFPSFTIEDFLDSFLDVVKKISTGITTEQLIEHMSDNQVSDYIVVYLRLITSGHLQKESEFFSNFIEGDRTISEFCKQEVEPMYKESDHIHIIAITASLNVGVRVIYMDRGTGGKVTPHDFGIETDSTQTPRVHLLYRPGHYDILYPN